MSVVAQQMGIRLAYTSRQDAYLTERHPRRAAKKKTSAATAPATPEGSPQRRSPETSYTYRRKKAADKPKEQLNERRRYLIKASESETGTKKTGPSSSGNTRRYNGSTDPNYAAPSRAQPDQTT
jgi:hypothetical protein